MRGLPSFYLVFVGRDHFSASLPLLALVKNVSLLNPSLDPDFTGRGGGVTPWTTLQGLFEASTCGGADVFLLAQQLDGCLIPAGSFQVATRVRLTAILSVDEALCDLSTFALVVLHLFSTGGQHLSTNC